MMVSDIKNQLDANLEKIISEQGEGKNRCQEDSLKE